MPYTTINKPSQYFNTILYTGTGSSNARTGVGFQPDWVWIKSRGAAAADHGLYDAVRGVQKQLESNTQTAETTETTGLTAFGSDGFTVGALAQLNTSAETYVAWNWLASNTSGSSNTSGTITSTVAANTTAGFSIVSYTGTGTTGTVGHGLGVAPKIIILKNRSAVANWRVIFTILDGTNDFMSLNLTDAKTDSVLALPTSSVFSISNGAVTGNSGNNYIAYCFAEVKGYSKFGSYTGNGSSDGTFIYTGFKPAFTIIKRTDSAENWVMQDSVRETFNDANRNALFPDTSDAEAVDTASLDYLSNGFKPRSAGTGNNGSGATYIYMCFASNPFVSSKGIPTTAR